MAIADINQMIGRSGRPRYDKQGDAYILLDADRFDEWKHRIETVKTLRQRLGIRTCYSFMRWRKYAIKISRLLMIFTNGFRGLLACLQGIIPAKPAEVIERLEGYGCIKLDGDKIYPTSLGEVAFWLYYAPRVVYRWRQNLLTFKNYFDVKGEVSAGGVLGVLDDVRLADLALAMTYTWDVDPRGYIMKTEKDRIDAFRSLIAKNFESWGDSIKEKAKATLKDARVIVMRSNGQEGTGSVRLIETC